MPEPITTGSTHTFRLYADKDGVDWDLDTPSTATITLYLTDPDGNEASYTASITTADSGIASYTVATTVLDQEGTWQRKWKVVQGTVTMWSRPIYFDVREGS